jgi:hypothetical protein
LSKSSTRAPTVRFVSILEAAKRLNILPPVSIQAFYPPVPSFPRYLCSSPLLCISLICHVPRLYSVPHAMIDSSVISQSRFSPIAGNEFKTRDDVIAAVHSLFNPLLPSFSEGKARVQIDASGFTHDRPRLTWRALLGRCSASRLWLLAEGHSSTGSCTARG